VQTVIRANLTALNTCCWNQ